MIEVREDVPITDSDQDEFGRIQLAKLIAESIMKVSRKEHSCLCYGIYGKWGEGKTSLMNMVGSLILSDSNIVTIKYNPWIVNNDQALIREFFNCLVGSIGDRSIIQLFKKYWKEVLTASKIGLITYKPELGTIISSVVDLICNLSDKLNKPLQNKKNKISESIVKSGKHLIVFIDDIDRLDKEEIHTLFRLIRMIADFVLHWLKNCESHSRYPRLILYYLFSKFLSKNLIKKIAITIFATDI